MCQATKQPLTALTVSWDLLASNDGLLWCHSKLLDGNSPLVFLYLEVRKEEFPWSFRRPLQVLPAVIHMPPLVTKIVTATSIHAHVPHISSPAATSGHPDHGCSPKPVLDCTTCIICAWFLVETISEENWFAGAEQERGMVFQMTWVKICKFPYSIIWLVWAEPQLP